VKWGRFNFSYLKHCQTVMHRRAGLDSVVTNKLFKEMD